MKIGLTYTGSEKKHSNYINWLLASGEEDMEIITLSFAHKNLTAIDTCDGVIFSGGIDIYPGFYGGFDGYLHAPSQFDQYRDEFEIAAFLKTQEKNIPVVGICRGMQLINCIYGGSLIQDIGYESNLLHKAINITDKRHAVIIEENSLLQATTGTLHIETNSAHHQAIDRLGHGLVVNARTPDGIIEGIERAEKEGQPFLLGIQWHPERMFAFQLDQAPGAASVRSYFMKEVKAVMALR